MCGHRAQLAPLLPTKRDLEGPTPPFSPRSAPKPALFFLEATLPPHTPPAAIAQPPLLVRTSTSTSACLAALGQDILDSLAAFMHPLDLARLSLCSPNLLRDVEASAALLLGRQEREQERAKKGEEEESPQQPSHSSRTHACQSRRYQYLCAFEVAAAGGAKLKAVIRQIYEDAAPQPAAAPSSSSVSASVSAAAGAVSPKATGEQINLSGAQVGDAGVAHLALALRVSKAHRVRLLNLSRCDITDQGARSLLHALAAHAEVDTLFLGQNRIGSRGAACLARYLASSPQIRSLSISDNPITDEGAHDIVGALHACASLATLSMRCQGVSSHVREAVRSTWGGRGGDSVFGLYI